MSAIAPVRSIPAPLDDAIVETLRTQPGIQRVPTPRLTLFIGRDFLDSQACAAVIDRIDTRRRPSTIADANGDTAFRTSETCDLDSADPVIDRLDVLISAFTGLDRAFGEPIQGQRYAVGQEFKAHTDYFEPRGMDYDAHCRHTGNRTWTVMIYLNAPQAGGATRFRAIDKTIRPETGKLLAWNNRRPDGSPNPATLHHGMKVRSGTKYIVTKWFRERPWSHM
ncbi:MAG TPA: 2OG-Fe(II) oxygenase [Sphingomonas sp.]|nr:2OG-Fe(II) oxygenase [Sphingomonas sp.]